MERKEIEITVACTACKTRVTIHADGTLCCSCDSLDHRPLGEVPEAWEISDEDFGAWADCEEPGELVRIA